MRRTNIYLDDRELALLVETARTWLRQARTAEPLAVSVVTVTELTGGMRVSERREV